MFLYIRNIHKSIATNMDVKFRVYAQTNTHYINRSHNKYTRSTRATQNYISIWNYAFASSRNHATASDEKRLVMSHAPSGVVLLSSSNYTYIYILLRWHFRTDKPGSKWKRFVWSNNHTPVYTTDDDDDGTHIKTFNLICTARSVYGESEDDTAQSNS